MDTFTNEDLKLLALYSKQFYSALIVGGDIEYWLQSKQRRGPKEAYLAGLVWESHYGRPYAEAVA